MSNLTAKQELFVAEYLKDLNATQAAIRAGYSVTSASDIGRELLGKTPVAEAVSAARTEQLTRVQLSADDVLRELLKIATVDLAAVYDEHGRMRPIHDIPVDVRKAMAGVEVDELFSRGEGAPEQIGHTRKVKFWDKTKALEMLGRHLAMFKDKVEISVDSKLTDELRTARERAAAFDLI